MASTSVSSIQKSFKYDVFLSFRGEDTRKNFVDHLYHALKQKSIVTYKDDENVNRGKIISDELIKAIQDSKFYVIIFSKNYASSSWCLEELVKIMECQTMDEHAAYPVFYDVEPTEVRKQSGSVGDAFSKHKEDEAAWKWREALKEASELAGWELKSIANGFRGEDTRKNFVDHLYHALKQKSIVTYKDDENVNRGKIISDELIKAIQDSKFYVIIFSKNYASSSWCLEELVKIMECQTMDEHAAYPVFYDVEPTEVRKQSGSVGDAFSKHKEDEAAWKWREALKEASELAGWELKSIANGYVNFFIIFMQIIMSLVSSQEVKGSYHSLGVYIWGGEFGENLPTLPSSSVSF
nr:Toll/interleukin-1 receptor (TIR) domain-containing protein [Tanacetum cinerariifolium]